jgi:K+-transporting ATPase c subunit
MQAKRVITARNFNKLQSEKLLKLINMLSKPPQFGILGNDVINVLKLNIQLDELKD